MSETPIRDPDRRDPVEVVAALAEPTRRRLHDWVVAQGRPVGRDEAAAALGIGRPLAAHHLDRLAEAGLLEPEYRRLTGRSGPGAGRPAKLYRRSGLEVAVSIPTRRYELAARMLAEGVDAARPGDPGPPPGVREAGRRHGRRLGAEARRRAGRRPSRRALRASLIEALVAGGYAPTERATGEIRMANCPYDALVADHRDLVCGMNLAIAEGLVDVVEPDRLTARLDPQPGWCCVAIEGRTRD
jgi:predicted ArsR family transcriptional regulator